MAEAFGVVEHDETGAVRIAVSGEVDVATAPVLRERLYQAVDSGAQLVVVDLLSVTFIDSTALGVLIGARERSESLGRNLRLVLREPRLVKIFEITGLTELFAIFPSVDEAITQ